MSPSPRHGLELGPLPLGWLVAEQVERRISQATLGLSARNVQPAGEQWPRDQAKSAWAQKWRKVLVVEDEAMVALSICDILSDMGLEVVGVAARAEDAVLKANIERPHLVIMDVRLQGQHDGIWAGNLILAEHEVPVIYMTAYQDRATLERLSAIPSAALVFKPFPISSLVRIVNKTMEEFYSV